MKRFVIYLTMAVWTATFPSAVQALLTATIDEPFSVGYGYSAPGFSTNDTADANTPPTAPNPNGSTFTIGDFKFSVTIASPLFSSTGPIFTNRVLNSGDATTPTGQSQFTTVSITAEYTGPNPPPDAEPGPTGFQLNIDQISVYALKYPTIGTTNELWWSETTPGNTNISASVLLNESTDIGNASVYKQLSWNPGEFFVPLGTNSTRTFEFPTDRNFLLDGLEIIGSGSYTYTVPEPSSMILMVATAVFFRRLRKGA